MYARKYVRPYARTKAEAAQQLEQLYTKMEIDTELQQLRHDISSRETYFKTKDEFNKDWALICTKAELDERNCTCVHAYVRT